MRNLDKLSEIDRSKTSHYMVVTVKRVSLTILQKENASLYQDMGEYDLHMIEDKKETVWSEYQAKELYQKIKNYVYNNLNEIDRQIMILRANNMSYKEIADLVGITDSNVSARLARLRKKMKADLALEVAEV